MSKWQKVYADQQAYRAQMVKRILEQDGLQPILVNKKDSSYHWGQIEVHVDPSDVLRAIKIINDAIDLG